MASHIILDAKRSTPTSSQLQIYYNAQARIYSGYAGTNKWSYAGIQGALVFGWNTSNNVLHFQMIDLDGEGDVIWDYELRDGLVLNQEKSVTFFLSFEGMVGGEVRC